MFYFHDSLFISLWIKITVLMYFLRALLTLKTNHNIIIVDGRSLTISKCRCLQYASFTLSVSGICLLTSPRWVVRCSIYYPNEGKPSFRIWSHRVKDRHLYWLPHSSSYLVKRQSSLYSCLMFRLHNAIRTSSWLS